MGTGTSLRRFLCPGQEKKRGQEVRGTACTGRYKGVRAVRLESVAGGGIPVAPCLPLYPSIFHGNQAVAPFQAPEVRASPALKD